MKFTDGTKAISQSTFTVKRVEDSELESDYNVEVGKQIGFDKAENKPVYLYHNVSAAEVKIGENVYNEKGNYIGYRCE